nr:hypothetical protein [Tanacetum cinerariifolium]
MNEALIPHAKRLRIMRSNFRLLSDIKSKDSTLQLVYDATANVHHHAIRFKMDNKKHIVNLESFKDMLHVCLRVPGQYFVEPLFEEEILAFIHFLGHSAVIRKLTDVEHKDSMKSNEMYYPRFTKVIIHHFMLKDPSIPRRNKFGALLPIELTNEEIRNSNAYKEYNAVATGATPPKPKASVWKTRISSDTTITPPTVAAEAQQLKLVTMRSLQQTHISQVSSSSADEGTSSIPGVPDVPIDESEEELSWNSTDEEGDDDKGKDGDGDDDGEEGDGDDDDEDDDGEEGNDDDDQEVKRDDEKEDEEEAENNDDKGNDEEDLGLNVDREGHDEEEEEYELYRDVNINQGRGIQTTLEVEDSHVTLTLVNPDVAPLPMTALTLTSSTIATITTTIQAPTLPTTAPSTLLQDLPNFPVNREFARDVYSKRRIIAVTELKIVEWHNYKHLDWITLLVQGKLTNLTVKERFAFNVSLLMFTRSIVIQRRVEDLQLGVESYQKKLNLTKLDTYRSDLKRKEAYIDYSNPRGFIYQNKDKKNRLMRIDKLHKFNDGTPTDVRTALDDCLKGIRMYSNPMIQSEPEGSTQGYLLASVEVLRYDKRNKSEYMGIVPTKMELILEHTLQGISHEVLIILTKARNPVNKILLKLNLSDHRKLKDVGEVLKLKNFKKDESKSYQDIQSRKMRSKSFSSSSGGSSIKGFVIVTSTYLRSLFFIGGRFGEGSSFNNLSRSLEDERNPRIDIVINYNKIDQKIKLSNFHKGIFGNADRISNRSVYKLESHASRRNSGSERFFHTKKVIKFMLAPRSAKAKHSSSSRKSHGMRNLPGSPSFSGNF